MIILKFPLQNPPPPKKKFWLILVKKILKKSEIFQSILKSVTKHFGFKRTPTPTISALCPNIYGQVAHLDKIEEEKYPSPPPLKKFKTAKSFLVSKLGKGSKKTYPPPCGYP